MDEQPGSCRWLFVLCVILVEVLGIAALVMTVMWVTEYRGGFAWQSAPGKEFNYHPLFMVIGLIFLYANAILVYRVFSNTNKKAVKIVHAVLHILALGSAAFALNAAFDSHNLRDPPIPNMYSLHSWLGIITVVLFGLQWVCGLVTFLVPGLAAHIRASYKPHHVFWGVVIFELAIATALMGITEKNIFSNPKYSRKNAEGVLTNTLGVTLVAMGTLVWYVLSNVRYRWSMPPQAEVSSPRGKKNEDTKM